MVDKIEGYNYYLKDKDKIYNLNIELYGIEDIKNIQYIYNNSLIFLKLLT